NDSDAILFDGQRENFFRIRVDGFAHARHAGRVGHRQIGAGLQRHLGDDFDLAAKVHEESAIGNLQDLDAIDGFDRVDDLVFMFAGNGVDGDVANDVVPANTHDIDSPDVASGLTDGGGDFAKGSGARGEF